MIVLSGIIVTASFSAICSLPTILRLIRIKFMISLQARLSVMAMNCARYECPRASNLTRREAYCSLPFMENMPYFRIRPAYGKYPGRVEGQASLPNLLEPVRCLLLLGLGGWLWFPYWGQRGKKIIANGAGLRCKSMGSLQGNSP